MTEENKLTDESNLRELFSYDLRSNVEYTDGRASSAPLLLFADFDYEVGDGVCGLHADSKQANEPAIVYVRADTVVDALARAEAAEAERDRLLPWAKLGAAVMEPWPDAGDLDGFQIHDMAVGAGVLREIPGGYNPDQHCDSVGVCPEPGDPWFECVNLPAALTTQEAGND